MGFKNAPSGAAAARPARLAAMRLIAVVLAAMVGLLALGGCGAGPEPAQPGTAAQEARPQVESAAGEAEDADPPAADPGASASDASTSPGAGDRAPLAGTDGAGVPQASELKVRFIDVGQGDCALISCDGQWLLIDAGPPKASSTVYSVLQRLGVTKIDYLVSTHPDADHAGGIAGALEAASCGTFFTPVTDSDTRTWRAVCERLALQGVPFTIPEPGDGFDLGAARVTFLGPVRAASDDNNNSLVLRIDHGDDSFLFTGDAERAEESDLLAAGVELRADVLKVGHHGSAGASSPAFLEAVAPRYAVISVGKNSYGHPTDEVLGRLAALDAEVLRTDQGGDILAVSNGEGVTFTRKGVTDE